MSKALPALAPFVPRMLRDDLLSAAPKCLSGATSHPSHAEQTMEDDSTPFTDAAVCVIDCACVTVGVVNKTQTQSGDVLSPVCSYTHRVYKFVLAGQTFVCAVCQDGLYI